MNVGDKVKFLSESMEGTVIRTDERGYVFVETTDGFEIPCKPYELVVVQVRKASPDTTTSVGAGHQPVGETSTGGFPTLEKHNVLSKSETEAKLLLGFMLSLPAQPSSSPVDCYIINDSKFDVLYTLGLVEGSHIRNLAHGVLESDTKELLVSLNQTEINKASHLTVQAIFFTPGRYLGIPVVDERVDIRRFAFYKPKEYTVNDYFDDPAIVFDIRSGIFEEKLEQLLEHGFAGKNIEVQQPERKIREQNPEEIDLHIESIIENYSGMSEGEIIRTQLDRFHAAMQSALLHGQKRLVFIHGVGTGKLKHEIRKALDSKYPDLRYQDASFREYGYGATMVFF